MIIKSHILAIEQAAGLALPGILRSKRDLLAHTEIKIEANKALDKPMQIVGGTAVISARGPLVKEDGFWVRWFGYSSTATLKDTVMEAAANPGVKSILMLIESPGGEVFGTADLADAIFQARKSKKVYAFIEDMGASAAYWMASQAEKVYSNPTALVGSIGTYMVVPDYSKWAADNGITVHVVKAGEFKGAGTPGTAITEPQLAKFQDEVNALNNHFLAGVARGRRMSLEQVQKIATGEVWVGKDAQAQGLIDGVQSLEETIQQLQSGHGGQASAGLFGRRNSYIAA